MTKLQSRLDPSRHATLRATLIASAAPSASPPVQRWRQAGLAMAVVAVVAVAASFLLVTDPAAPPGYASWTAVPQAVPPPSASRGDIEKWASKCSDLGVGGVGIEGVPARPDAAAKREVIVDRRGDFTFCVDVSLGSGTESDPLIALSGIRGGEHGLNSMEATVFDKPFPRPAADGILMLSGGLYAPPPSPEPGVDRLDVRQAFGLSGAGVTGVDVVLTNGLRVTATLRNGVWGAWWPSERGDPAGCVLELHTATGIRTVDPQKFELHFD